MVCKYPFDLKVISFTLGLNYNKFYRWYKNIFSEYKTAEVQLKLHEHDIGGKSTIHGKPYTIKVPILKPEHIGSHMAIDEKHINGIFYTVLTNGESSKVALMVASMNPKVVGECVSKFGDKLQNVKTLSRDLSTTYHSIGNQYFPNAIQIADKYHIIAHALDAVQDVRIRLKQQENKQERIAQENHQKNYQEYVGLKKADPKTNHYKVSKVYYPNKLKNGETKAELLTRCKYLLYKLPSKWTEQQAYRAEILFNEFPEIKQAYQLINQFRKWYEPNEIKDKN